jgi:hypothetical protein
LPYLSGRELSSPCQSWFVHRLNELINHAPPTPAPGKIRSAISQRMLDVSRQKGQV